jgi:hypothetical protein
MSKSLLVIGVAMLVVGLALFGFFVLPSIVSGGLSSSVPDLAGRVSNRTPWLAMSVLGAAAGLAGGCALIGIGMGHWKRPVPSPADGSPEI